MDITAEHVSVSMPYPEGAIRSVVSHLRRNDALGQLFYPARPVHVISDLIRRNATRVAVGSVLQRDAEHERSRSVAGFADTVRIAGRAFRSTNIRRDSMHMHARLFDAAVAKRIGLRDSSPMIGMPGACLRTFEALRMQGRRSILHAVNAHPLAHNELLLRAYRREEVAGELIPPFMTHRILSELAVSDLVVVPSVMVADQMLSNGMRADQVVIEPYGVDLGFWAAPQTGSHARERMASGPVKLLFVGQVGYRKGVPHLLKAMELLDNRCQLTVIGPKVNLPSSTSIPANTRLIGVQSRAQIRAAMFDADAFVLPSVEDACALVVAEAAATGLPVVTTRSNGAVDQLPLDLARIVEPAEPYGLADVLGGLCKLASDERSANAAFMRSHGNIRSWDDYAQALCEVVISGPL